MQKGRSGDMYIGAVPVEHTECNFVALQTEKCASELYRNTCMESGISIRPKSSSWNFSVRVSCF